MEPAMFWLCPDSNLAIRFAGQQIGNAPRERPVIGTIKTPIACDSDLEDFTMYDVRFAFGELTLYGSQLDLLEENDFTSPFL